MPSRRLRGLIGVNTLLLVTLHSFIIGKKQKSSSTESIRQVESSFQMTVVAWLFRAVGRSVRCRHESSAVLIHQALLTPQCRCCHALLYRWAATWYVGDNRGPNEPGYGREQGCLESPPIFPCLRFSWSEGRTRRSKNRRRESSTMAELVLTCTKLEGVNEAGGSLKSLLLRLLRGSSRSLSRTVPASMLLM